ncbi:hypothetical protein ACM42_05265 [Bradyrhizobium sp. CCBAU 25338]|nr:hypothetical protein [Bradyrhizobium sp. CCBAU 25338]
MKEGDSRFPNIRFICLPPGPWYGCVPELDDMRAERRHRADLPDPIQSTHNSLKIIRMFKQARKDGDWSERIVRCQFEMTRALRIIDVHEDGHQVSSRGFQPSILLGEAEREEVKLQIRLSKLRRRSEKGEDLRRRHAHEPRPFEDPLRQGECSPYRMRQCIRGLYIEFGKDIQTRVLHQIPSNLRTFHTGNNAMFCEMTGITDTGKHQQVRGIDGAGRKNDTLSCDEIDILSAMRGGNAPRARLVKQNVANDRLVQERQITG